MKPVSDWKSDFVKLTLVSIALDICKVDRNQSNLESRDHSYSHVPADFVLALKFCRMNPTTFSYNSDLKLPDLPTIDRMMTQGRSSVLTTSMAILVFPDPLAPAIPMRDVFAHGGE